MGYQAGYSDSGSRPIRILHVDDEPTDLEITRIFLQRKAKSDFEIVSVLSAKEALDKLGIEHFDIVISDYKMPGMDGIKFLETMRNNENSTDIPFILFTGKGGEGVAAAALSRGADRYITKSGNPAGQCDALMQAIQELLNQKMNDADDPWNKKALNVTVKGSQY